jgi:hypothetical protein
MLELMRGCCSDQQAGLAHTTQLYVFDCRPCALPQPSCTAKLSHIACSLRNSNILHRYINAAANTAMGKGTEGKSYSNCRQTHPQPPPAAGLCSRTCQTSTRSPAAAPLYASAAATTTTPHTSSRCRLPGGCCRLFHL